MKLFKKRFILIDNKIVNTYINFIYNKKYKENNYNKIDNDIFIIDIYYY